MTAPFLLTVLFAGLLLQGCQPENLDDYQVLDHRESALPDAEAAAVPGEPVAGTGKQSPADEEVPQATEAAANESTAMMPPDGAGDRPVEFSPPADGGAVALTTGTTPSAPGDAPAIATAQGSATEEDPPAELTQEIKLLIPLKVFVPEGDALRLTFDDIDLLKVLNMEKVPLNAVDYMPDWLKGLDGKKVTLRGWMYPPGKEEGIRRFIFVRDNGVCCFGPKAKIYDKVAVTLRDGAETSAIVGHSFDVTGTFTVEADVLDDELMFLYFMDDCVIVNQ